MTKKIRDIVNAHNRATAESNQSALATAVCVKGSSYRRPGARMMVTVDGQLTGTVRTSEYFAEGELHKGRCASSELMKFKRVWL